MTKKQSILNLSLAFLVFVSSVLGLVYIPEALMKERDKANETVYQVPPSIKLGHKIYIREGCIYCHSQQTRPENFGADIARGWGRASQPEDYQNLTPHVLGTMRTGPDLANIGARQPSRDWHHVHLFNPQTVSPGSVMPPFGWLYRIVDENQAAENALALPPDFRIPGKKVVPTAEAEALVDYLLSLDQKEKS
jgi:cytochrome c oxidase cbb3-type subunit 2